MKIIPLSKGKYAIVDDEDFEFLSQWNWAALECFSKCGGSIWYAIRHTTSSGPKIWMHREIIKRAQLPIPDQVDHADCNGLNNQRSNLRACSQSQNQGNRRKLAPAKSRFKGVTWAEKIQKWRARVQCDGKRIQIGYFGSEEAAARAYDFAAKDRFGKFARVNLLCESR